MELNFSKFNFLLVVVWTILQMPRGSEGVPLITQLHKQCGKNSVIDSGPGHENVARELPWVVAVIAEQGNEKHECSGSIVAPQLVLTSKHCAPKEPQSATYEVHYDYGRTNPVSQVHLYGDSSPFMVLEVSTPFRTDFTVCIAYTLLTDHLNKTLRTASWVKEKTISTATGLLHQEKWTLADAPTACKTTCKPDSATRCTCALSSEVGWRDCRGDEGKPVMRWAEGAWYLVGVVTEVYLENGTCAIHGLNDRLYQTLLSLDAVKVGKLVKSD